MPAAVAMLVAATAEHRAATHADAHADADRDRRRRRRDDGHADADRGTDADDSTATDDDGLAAVVTMILDDHARRLDDDARGHELGARTAPAARGFDLDDRPRVDERAVRRVDPDVRRARFDERLRRGADVEVRVAGDPELGVVDGTEVVVVRALDVA